MIQTELFNGPGQKTTELLDAIIEHWPEHANYLSKSFKSRSPDVLRASEDLSGAILKLTRSIPGGIAAMVSDYRFVCEEIVLPEELYFRRHGTYRNSTFEQADKECYSNPQVYDRYMNGLLLSDVMWANHAAVFAYFRDTFLPMLPDGAQHLEIGPGHGLFLYFAAAQDRLGTVAGMDVSPTSIEKTRHALEILAVKRPVDLKLQDIMEAVDTTGGNRFDSIVISEVLEHLEDPHAGLAGAAQWLAPGGLILINVPANSPAPDHIYLLSGPDHLDEMVRDAGLEIVNSAAFPMSGASLERALRNQLSISCVVIARKAA